MLFHSRMHTYILDTYIIIFQYNCILEIKTTLSVSLTSYRPGAFTFSRRRNFPMRQGSYRPLVEWGSDSDQTAAGTATGTANGREHISRKNNARAMLEQSLSWWPSSPVNGAGAGLARVRAARHSVDFSRLLWARSDSGRSSETVPTGHVSVFLPN